MANCGMTQKDCADLTPNQIDWTAGTITRKRSKEKGAANVPTVTWKLWASTLAALRAVRQPMGDRVLLNSDGNPLVYSALKPTGKLSDCDCVGSAFELLVKRAWTLKNFRSTSATAIGNHPEFCRFAQYFLDHAPKTIADKHYVKPSQADFDRCVLWLGSHLGLDRLGVES